MRGATDYSRQWANRCLLISIHAPREGRDRPPEVLHHGRRISIHAPREGRDERPAARTFARSRFQSTRPARGATSQTRTWLPSWLFQSTRPARGATYQHLAFVQLVAFQSTRPARGATMVSIAVACKTIISIHAPREGRDSTKHWCRIALSDFNPRAPRGARQVAG